MEKQRSNLSFSHSTPCQTCRINFPKVRSSPALALFSLDTVRFKFAEHWWIPVGSFLALNRPSKACRTLMTTTRRSSFHVVIITFYSRLKRSVPFLPNMMIRRPTLQTTNNFFTHGNRPFHDACQSFAVHVGTFFSSQGSSTSGLARSFD